MAQSRFMVGTQHESRLMRGRCKTLDLVGIPQMEHLCHQSINLVQQSGKNLEGVLKPTCYSSQTTTQSQGAVPDHCKLLCFSIGAQYFCLCAKLALDSRVCEKIKCSAWLAKTISCWKLLKCFKKWLLGKRRVMSTLGETEFRNRVNLISAWCYHRG